MQACEYCKGPLAGAPDEAVALSHGLVVCQGCLDSMEAERDAYEQIMTDEGYRCEFDPESGRFVTRRIESAVPTARGGGVEGEG